jgi:polysaccharide export outer membrane protein
MGFRSHTLFLRGPLARAAALGIAALCLACATTPAPAPVARLPEYLVGAPDELLVTVLPDPVVQQRVVVRPDGMITIQLIGEVRAADRAPDEIAAEIEERIGRYKRGARATVAVERAVSSAVTVLGEVRMPGTFPLAKLTRVAEALGHVGGPTNFARIARIQVVRPGEAGAEVFPVDLAAIRSGDLKTNLALEGGDIIYVPPTFLAKVGYAVQQMLFPLNPLLGVATSAAGTMVAP